MPLEVPNLDDRTFADLVEEALSILPQYAPAWTNHNPSDPGITLIELLAYFTELLIYRLNRVSRENQIRFLYLLRGAEWEGGEGLADASLEDLQEALGTAVLELRQPQRAVTGEDFEYLARQAALDPKDGPQPVRAHCAVRRNLEASAELRALDSPGHVSVVIVPEQEALRPQDLKALVDKVRARLAPKCLLTTRLHVVEPFYVWVSLGADIRLRTGASFDAVRRQAVAALEHAFSPFPGAGPHAEGWPFGRGVYLSEVFETLEGVAGIDSVEAVRVLQLAMSEEHLHTDRAAAGVQIGFRSTLGVDARLGADAALHGKRLLRSDSGELIAIALQSYELVRIVVLEENLRLLGPAV